MNTYQSSGLNENPPVPPIISDSRHNHWLKQLFVKNPFYLISAGLLLYGIYRLSVDPKVFASEVGQLFFNFGSFQIYELLLVVTAIILARKKIWYDASLLVCLENLFLFIPFILISQALLIQNQIAVIFSCSACALVLARCGGLKKFLTEWTTPTRLFLFGGVLLIMNVVLPLLFRILQERTTALTHDIYANEINKWLWIFAAPILLGLINLLPRPKTSGEIILHKGYFPLLLLAVWTAVTCAHLYCIGYIHELKWEYAFLAPLLWVGAWTFWNRLSDFDFLDSERDLKTRELLLIPTMIATLLAAFSQNWNLFFALNALNCFGYAIIFVRQQNFTALYLTVASAALMFAGLPVKLLTTFHLQLERDQCFGIALAVYILIYNLLSRNPKIGLVGGLTAGIFAAIRLHGDTAPWLAFQIGLIFLLAHSLRWEDAKHPSAKETRILVATLWVLHTIFWLYNQPTALMTTVSCATVLLSLYGVVRLLTGNWAAKIIPIAAILILLTGPVLKLQTLFQNAPAGILAVIGSFVLFGIGTLLAFSRNRLYNRGRFAHAKTQFNQGNP